MSQVPSESDRFHQVYLMVYDLQANGVMHWVGLGAYHTSVLYRASEWSFGEDGIGENDPGKGVELPLRESIYMGEAKMDFQSFQKILNELRMEFKSYHVTECNCNHFSDAFCRKLVGKSIPGWINRVSRMENKVSKWIFSKKKKDEFYQRQKEQQAHENLKKNLPHSQSSKEISIPINAEKCYCLNINPSHSIQSLFNGKKSSTVESNADEQLIIHIPMEKTTTLTSISIISNDKNVKKHPRTIKLYINRKDLDFQNIDDAKPMLSANQDDPKVNEFHQKLKRTHFKSVHHLTVYIESNHGDEVTTLSTISMKGIIQ